MKRALLLCVAVTAGPVVCGCGKEETDRVADIGPVVVYRWRATKPVGRWRLLIDGSERPTGTLNVTSRELELAVVKQDNRRHVYVRIGSGTVGAFFDLAAAKTLCAEHVTTPGTRALEVSGPTVVYSFAQKLVDTDAVVRKAEVVVLPAE